MQRYRQRKSPRLKGYDYSQDGAYFVTICTHNRAHLFGTVADDAMWLNNYGDIAADVWTNIPRHFPHVQLGPFVIMPNHMHGIVGIMESPRSSVGATDRSPNAPKPDPIHRATHASPLPSNRPNGPSRGSLGAIVGQYKSTVTRQIRKLHNPPDGPIWQRNYHDHIIRTRRAYNTIFRYIHTNPQRWEHDTLYSSA